MCWLRVYTMQLKNGFRQVDADCSNLHDDASFRFSGYGRALDFVMDGVINALGAVAGAIESLLRRK